MEHSYTYKVTKVIDMPPAVRVLYCHDDETFPELSRNLLLPDPTRTLSTEDLERLVAQNAPLHEWTTHAHLGSAPESLSALLGKEGSMTELKRQALLEPDQLPADLAPPSPQEVVMDPAGFAAADAAFEAENAS